MKKFVLLLILLLPQQVGANTFIQQTVNGHLFKVIDYDLSSDIYDIKVIKTDDATNLGNLMKQNNAITGVNGVFFCPTDYDWCNTTKSFTDNERYIQGEKFARYLTTGDRAVFGWTKDKIPLIYQSGKINMDSEDTIYYGLGNYPLLLSEGKNMLEDYWDKGLIDNKMKAQGTRNFICSNKEKSHIYFGLVYNATIEELTAALRSFGCYDALNLDAGLSTVFMYNNSYLVGPQKRDILDAVVIERKGLDMSTVTQKGKEISDSLIHKIETKYINKPEKAQNYAQKYIQSLESIRSNFYDKKAKSITETNIVGEEENIGYKIEINSLKQLTGILIINEVINNLKIYKNNIIITSPENTDLTLIK